MELNQNVNLVRVFLSQKKTRTTPGNRIIRSLAILS